MKIEYHKKFGNVINRLFLDYFAIARNDANPVAVRHCEERSNPEKHQKSVYL